MAIARGGEYVAMGSSFAAGPGLTPRSAGAPRRSGRSDINYAHLIAARWGLTLRDVTFSGATTADILEGTTARPAQIDAVTSATRLVTITAGGNDVGYLPALTLASLPWPLRVLPALRRRVADLANGDATDARFQALAQTLTTLVRAVHEREPEADIVLVDYLTILPRDGGTDRQLSRLRSSRSGDVASWAKSVAARLSELFETVALSEGCTFVDVGALSREHDAWSSHPWTRRFHLSLRGGAPYHPNAAGMRAVADMVIHRLE